MYVLPPVFIEQEQLLLGNAFARRLAQQINSANPALGQREAIRLVDAGASLSEHFDVDLAALLPTTTLSRYFLADAGYSRDLKHE
jgi:hypothetical protein